MIGVEPIGPLKRLDDDPDRFSSSPPPPPDPFLLVWNWDETRFGGMSHLVRPSCGYRPAYRWVRRKLSRKDKSAAKGNNNNNKNDDDDGDTERSAEEEQRRKEGDGRDSSFFGQSNNYDNNNNNNNKKYSEKRGRLVRDEWAGEKDNTKGKTHRCTRTQGTHHTHLSRAQRHTGRRADTWNIGDAPKSLRLPCNTPRTPDTHLSHADWPYTQLGGTGT